jgi:ADP-ribose pyrophosphatase
MKHKNAERYGFKIISSVLEHENPYYSVHKYEVKYPKGFISPYWIVEKSDFSVVIPLFSDKTTLLVGQYRIPGDFYSWEFPMGTVKGSEPIDNAKQELEEETGYRSEKWQAIGSYFIGPGTTNVKANIFIAEDLHEGVSHQENTEILHIKHVALSEVKKSIEIGLILDGPTIVAYHYLESYLKNKL